MLNATSKTTDKKPPLWLRFFTSKATFFIAFVVFAFLTPKIYFNYQTSKIPDIDHPFDIESFGTVEIKPEENAFIEYEQASLMFVPLSSLIKDDDFYATLEGDWSYATEEIKKWLNRNQKSLKKWKQGTKKPDFLYYQPKDQRFSTDIRVAQDLRDLVWLATLQGKKLQAEGKMQEAWEWHRAMLRSSRHVGKHGTIIERVIGASIHRIAIRAILHWANDSRVNAKQLKRAIKDIALIYEMTEPYSTSVKCEYLVRYNILNEKDSEEYLFDNSYHKYYSFFFSSEPEISKRVLKHIFRNDLHQIDQPRYLHSSSTVMPSGSLTPSEINKFMDKAQIAKSLLPAIWGPREDVIREENRQGIALVVLAAQQYKRDHGAFPINIALMTKGNYLKEIPLDTQQTTKTEIQYRYSKKQIVVYSLGENNVDDGGRIVYSEAPIDLFDLRADDYGCLIKTKSATE